MKVGFKLRKSLKGEKVQAPHYLVLLKSRVKKETHHFYLFEAETTEKGEKKEVIVASQNGIVWIELL